MTYSLTWLPDVLEAAGLKVAETPDWRTRGHGDMGTVRGVMCHHTATPRGGNMPTLNLLIKGRAASATTSALGGPLAQLGLGRDGTFYVVASGRANHAGAGIWQGVRTGNSSFIGIEAENAGVPSDPWPDVQLDAYYRGVAAILRRIRADARMCCGHKEYALPHGRKLDPTLNMTAFRASVASYLDGAPVRPPIPAVDTLSRPTLRRGSADAAIVVVQRRLGIDADGIFGGTTEAALRQFQRDRDLVPDGIVGPATWRALDSKTPIPPRAATVVATPSPVPTLPVASQALPPADDGIRAPKLQGTVAVTPDGRRFAVRSGAGFYTTGTLSLPEWLAQEESGPASAVPSLQRVVAALCMNEGGLDAVNSYDGCHMSFGIFQWSAGIGNEPGELPILLAKVKGADGSAFAECFGGFGLDVAGTGTAIDPIHLVLNGKGLIASTEKDALRDVVWAYRFWRAGHHPVVRTAQFAHAVDRVSAFQNMVVRGHRLDEWITSELGVALILDEHVNRPGHVPKTLVDALASMPTVNDRVDEWSTDDEHALIQAYLAVRKLTSMTDSDKRAARIGTCVQGGRLSDTRGSFAC